MRLRNILIVVEDIEKSKKFYHDLFGLDVILDNEGNVILMTHSQGQKIVRFYDLDGNLIEVGTPM